VLIKTVLKLRTFAGKRKYLRANCKIYELLRKICAPQGPKFAQKLRAKAKFAKNAISREKVKFAQKLRPARTRFSSGTV